MIKKTGTQAQVTAGSADGSVGSSAGGAVGGSVPGSAGSSINSSTGGLTGGSAGNSMGSSIVDSTGNSVGSSAVASKGSSTNGPTAGTATDTTTNPAIGTATGSVTGTATRNTPSGERHAIRIAVVDDHEMFRAGVIATLSPHFDIVGQAPDVEGSVAMIADTKPDVVLLDVHVPGGEGGGGAEILLKSRPLSPNSAFLALSVSDSPKDVGAVIRAGALGYVTKTISGNDLISSIIQVHEGYAVFSPKLAGFVLSTFQGAGPAEQDDELDKLSHREQEVMRLIARGYTYKEISAELFISVKTVETHVSAVLRKLQLCNRTELTRWAADRRIV